MKHKKDHVNKFEDDSSSDISISSSSSSSSNNNIENLLILNDLMMSTNRNMNMLKTLSLMSETFETPITSEYKQEQKYPTDRIFIETDKTPLIPSTVSITQPVPILPKIVDSLQIKINEMIKKINTLNKRIKETVLDNTIVINDFEILDSTGDENDLLRKILEYVVNIKNKLVEV